MLICKWEDLPKNMQTDEVRPYWEKLRKRNWNLFWKRVFDIVVSSIMLLFLVIPFIIIAIAIKFDSKGPVFYRQVRITQYGKEFRIHKFRSMIVDADKGSQVTLKDDERITKVGKFIRKFKLDEISQFIDVFEGNMTFVGTRPEVKKYVDKYTSEMMATLLIPAGVTSFASIQYRDENNILESSMDVDYIYINEILPIKMKFNLEELLKVGVFHDIKEMLVTFFAIVL